MLETLSVRPRICDQIRSGPLGRWVDDFVDVLMTRGYATGTVRACRRMSSATLPRCTCSRPASTWRPSRCGSATSDSKPPINTSRRTCNSRKTLCENSSRSVNERSGSRPTPRCWPSWRASDYDQQTTCWTPTATVSPTVTCHNAMLVILTGMTSWSYLSVPRARQQPTAGRSATPVILAKRPAGCSPAGRRLVQACFIPRPGDPSRGAVDQALKAHDLSGGATSRPTAAANMLQKMSRLTNSEAKACPDLVERFGALRPDERWMTAPRGEVAERADASIRQDSVTQAAWRRFQPLRRSSPRGRPRASYSATGP